MRSRIGFIAIGQAGGNIGKLFEEKGYPVLYLNTSQEDLRTLKNAKYTYHIAGGEGCNKDRDKAKRLVAEDFENISREIREKMDVAMVFCIFASGGGTGSGCGPMLIDLLLEEGFPGGRSRGAVGAITVIPNDKESPKAHINSYECFSELTGIEGMAATMAIDNARGDKLALNQRFVTLFHDYVEIPRRHKAERGNIDWAEIEETLKAKGMLVITEVPAKESTTASVLESLRQTIFAPIEADRVIKYIAVSIAGSVDVDAMRKEVGIPLDVFATYNDRATVCCLSGLNYPRARLDAVYGKAVEHQEQIVRNLQATSGFGMKKGVNFLSSARPEPPREKPSRRDLMKKYMG